MPIDPQNEPASRHFGKTRSFGLIAVSLRRAWFGVGPIATLRALIKHFSRTDPEAHRPITAPLPGPHPFDAEFSVHTGGFVGWRDLQSGGRNDPYISGYFGVTPSIARRLIATVDNPADYVFIDLGCGKGRATILASERHFRQIIGVEIAASLVAVAIQNAAAIRTRNPGRPAIDIVHADVAVFTLPLFPLVLFLYQPFEQPVMRALLTRLATSLAEHKRPVILLYVYPALAQLLDDAPFLERRADAVFEPADDELSFSYGGRGGTERVGIWATRDPAPALTAPV